MKLIPNDQKIPKEIQNMISEKLGIKLMNEDPLKQMRRYASKKLNDESAKLLEKFFDTVDMDTLGPAFLSIACTEGNREIAEILVERGVSVLDPPYSISDDELYRKSPFVL